MSGTNRDQAVLASILRPENRGADDFQILRDYVVLWNQEHALVKMLQAYSMLEREEEIKLMQRDYLADVLTNLFECYSDAKRKSKNETTVQYYLEYMGEKYKTKQQISRMSNAFAYSLQLYSARNVEMRHFYDFFNLNRSCHKEVAFFLRARKAILKYLQNTTTLENVELDAEQWAALLSRIFSENTNARDAVVEKIRHLHMVLPSQKYPEMTVRATTFLEICFELKDIKTLRKPPQKIHFQNHPTTDEKLRDQKKYIRRSPNSFNHRGETHQEKGIKYYRTPLTEQNKFNWSKSPGKEEASQSPQKLNSSKIGEVLHKPNNTNTSAIQIIESNNSSRFQNRNIEQEQTEQMGQNRQYHKREVAERVIEKRKIMKQTAQVMELYEELAKGHNYLLNFSEDLQNELANLLCLIKENEKEFFELVDLEQAKRFLSYKVDPPKTFKIKNMESYKPFYEKKNQKSPSNWSEAWNQTNTYSKLQPTILKSDLNSLRILPQSGSYPGVNQDRINLTLESLSKIYDKILKHDEVREKRIKNQMEIKTKGISSFDQALHEEPEGLQEKDMDPRFSKTATKNPRKLGSEAINSLKGLKTNLKIPTEGLIIEDETHEPLKYEQILQKKSTQRLPENQGEKTRIKIETGSLEQSDTTKQENVEPKTNTTPTGKEKSIKKEAVVQEEEKQKEEVGDAKSKDDVTKQKIQQIQEEKKFENEKKEIGALNRGEEETEAKFKKEQERLKIEELKASNVKSKKEEEEVVKQKLEEQKDVKKKQEDEEAAAAVKKKKEEEEAAKKLKEEEEEAKKKKEQEEEVAKKTLEQQEAAKKKQEEEAATAAAKKKREEEEAAKKKEEEEAVAKKLKEEEEARKKKEDEDVKKLKEEEETKKKKEQEEEAAKKKLEEQAVAKKKQEEEQAAAAAKKKREEEVAKKKEEEEAVAKKVKEEEEARKKKEEEEKAKAKPAGKFANPKFLPPSKRDPTFPDTSKPKEEPKDEKPEAAIPQKNQETEQKIEDQPSKEKPKFAAPKFSAPKNKDSSETESNKEDPKKEAELKVEDKPPAEEEQKKDKPKFSAPKFVAPKKNEASETEQQDPKKDQPANDKKEEAEKKGDVGQKVEEEEKKDKPKFSAPKFVAPKKKEVASTAEQQSTEEGKPAEKQQEQTEKPPEKSVEVEAEKKSAVPKFKAPKFSAPAKKQDVEVTTTEKKDEPSKGDSQSSQKTSAEETKVDEATVDAEKKTPAPKFKAPKFQPPTKKAQDEQKNVEEGTKATETEADKKEEESSSEKPKPVVPKFKPPTFKKPT